MKRILNIASVVACLMAVTSCGSGQKDIEDWFVDLQLIPYIDMKIITDSNASINQGRHYDGTLRLESHGMTEAIPITIYPEGSNRKFKFRLDDATLEQRMKTFFERAYLAEKISVCESWDDLGKVLTGPWLSEWCALEERRAALYEEYRNYYPNQYSRKAMDAYNAFITKNVNNFLSKIGGQKLYLDHISEEERLQATSTVEE